uniref:Polyprotein n=1 Tax=Heterorhabditis bacteriophora TaxID=37862 RepID=A0A1I7X0I2_HETBA
MERHSAFMRERDNNVHEDKKFILHLDESTPVSIQVEDTTCSIEPTHIEECYSCSKGGPLLYGYSTMNKQRYTQSVEINILDNVRTELLYPIFILLKHIVFICTYHSHSAKPSLQFLYSNIFRMTTKYTSTYLEERLRKELMKKLTIAKNTTKIPTPKDILDTITQCADRCYWITDDYHTAFTEYQTLQLSARATPQKLFMEISMLLSKHRNMLRMREQDATRFNNAHEIYETLTAGGVLDELERVSSITELANRKLQDAPNGVVNPHYERLDSTLLKQESSRHKNRQKRKLKEMTQSLLNSEESTQTQTNVQELKAIEQAIVDLTKGLRIQDILHITRDKKIESMQESINTLARTIEASNATLLEQLTKKVSETITTRTIATQVTDEVTTETHSVATQVVTTETHSVATQ